jgi:hypothetical protein
MIMDLESDFIFDSMCDDLFPVIKWMLEECDDVKEKDIPQMLTEDEDVTMEQAERIFIAYSYMNNNE